MENINLITTTITNKSDVITPPQGTIYVFKIDSKIYQKMSNGIVMPYPFSIYKIGSQDQKDAKQIEADGHKAIFALILKNCSSVEQTNRLLAALDKYTGIYLILEAKNWDLAKSRIDVMLSAGDITSDDKILINKYINMAAFTL